MENISNLVQDVNKRIYLPGIQREFVWDEDQIELLFDSLMRQYPVGLITRWDVLHSSADYHAYEFVENFVDDDGSVPDEVLSEGFSVYNENVDDEENPQYLVIDGQQRLTALYIGLSGRIARYTKGSGGSRDNPAHWSTYRLCINIFGHPEFQGDKLSGDYEFEFRRTSQFGKKDRSGLDESDGIKRYWFPLEEMMKDTMEAKNKQTLNQITDSQIEDLEMTEEKRAEMKTIKTNLISHFDSSVLNEGLPTKDVEKSSKDIKTIFQRINIEGEDPDPYQLLMSRTMSTWPFAEPGDKQFNPRDKTEQWVQTAKSKYPSFETNIDRELVMRYSIYLIDEMLKTSDVKKLSEELVLTIRDRWLHQPEGQQGYTQHSWFFGSLENAIETLERIGFTEETMSAKAIIAALAKFYYRNPEAEPTNDENLNNIYLLIARLLLLKESKGSLGRVEARRLSNYLHEQPEGKFEAFPVEEAFSYLEVEIAVETVRKIVENARYETDGASGKFHNKNVAAILGLARESYQNNSAEDLEVDHIYPSSRAGEVQKEAGIDDEEFSIQRLGNLQLLNKDENNRKDDNLPNDWLTGLGNAERDKYQRINDHPKIDPTLSNYQEFVKQREENLIEEVSRKVAEGEV